MAVSIQTPRASYACRFPIAFRIIADMEDIVRIQMH